MADDVWVALWGSVTPANVLGGLVLGVAVAAPAARRAAPEPARCPPWACCASPGSSPTRWCARSVAVAAQVLRPHGLVLHPGVIAVTVPGADDRLLTLLANSISLTPGTLTLEVDRDRRLLHVHVLDLGPDARDLPAVRADLDRLERAASRGPRSGRP